MNTQFVRLNCLLGLLQCRMATCLHRASVVIIRLVSRYSPYCKVILLHLLRLYQIHIPNGCRTSSLLDTGITGQLRRPGSRHRTSTPLPDSYVVYFSSATVCQLRCGERSAVHHSVLLRLVSSWWDPSPGLLGHSPRRGKLKSISA
jgi:hypothetical protein